MQRVSAKVAPLVVGALLKEFGDSRWDADMCSCQDNPDSTKDAWTLTPGLGMLALRTCINISLAHCKYQVYCESVQVKNKLLRGEHRFVDIKLVKIEANINQSC